MPGQPNAPSAPSTPSTPSTSCCETGRPVATDPVTGQAICSCQYEPGAAGRPGALGGYPRLAAGSSSISHSAAYAGGEQAPYPSIGVDGSYFAAFVSISTVWFALVCYVGLDNVGVGVFRKKVFWLWWRW